MVFQNFESIDGTYYSREQLPENAYSRVEQYLRELCLLEGSPLPVPKTRIEKLLNCLVTGESDFEEPQSRIEGLIYALITGDESKIETCASRVEVLWYMLVKDLDAEALLGTKVNGKVVEDCFSRVESYLWNLLHNGEHNGELGGSVLYELNNQVTMYNTIVKSVNSGTLLGNTMVNIVGDNVTVEEEVTGTESFEHDEDSTIKSAILLGQTLVNLAVDGLTEKILSPNRYADFVSNLYKQSTTYTIVLNVVTLSDTGTIAFHEYDEGTSLTTKIAKINVGINKILFTSSNNVFNRIRLRNPSAATTNLTIKNVMILEGDYTNIDIPYFEGMTSVKMPVLTTTGKNFFDIDKFASIGIDEQGYYFPRKFVDNAAAKATLKLKPNTKYVVMGTYIYTGNARFMFRINDGPYQNVSGSFETDATGVVNIKIGSNSVDVSDPSKMEKIMIVESTLKDIYEPFKSNILTCNEEVELRGIGDMRDELDLLTGEVVNKFGEIVLNGDESWNSYRSQSNQVNTVAFKLPHTNHNSSWGTGLGCCDKILFTNGDVIYGQDLEGVTTDANNIIVRVSISKASSVDEFKAWLSNNNIRVVYPLKEEVIKTVDLSILNQDEVEVPNVTLFANGQITTSSEVLIPTLEYEFILNNQYELPALQSATYTIQNDGTPFTLNGVEYSGVEQKQLISVSNVTNKVLTTEDKNMIIVKGNQLEENISTLEKRKLLAVKNPIITLSDENGINSNSANFEGSFYKIPNFDADITTLNGETTRNSRLLSYNDLTTTWTLNSTMASQFNTIAFTSNVELLSSVANSVVGTYNNLFGDYKANDLFITDCEGVTIYNDQLCIRVNRARLETEDVDGLETYLATNEFECLYVVDGYTENIVVNGELSTYDGITIATVSSENNVLPTVSLQVETSNQEDLEAIVTGYTLLENTQSETSTAIEKQESNIQTVSDKLSETSDLESIILEITNQMEGE